ncbi:MAG: hypothetical protein ABIO43_07980 [Sphingomicrobium sp.]
MGGVAIAVVLAWAQAASTTAPADPPADAASFGPSLPVPPKPSRPPEVSKPCAIPVPTDPGEVLVCAARPHGYRIDPDVLAAKKAKRGGGRPKPPDRMVDTSCKVVGPMGCGSHGIDLLGAALTLAKMADKVSKGENIGGMFITDPHLSEYQLYQQAKREREAKEEEARTQEAVKAAKAAAGK